MEMLNLRQIEVFRAVMETGSFTGAAQMLHVSQPGISRLMRHLELRLGVHLFERLHGKLLPTPEARTLHAEVQRSYRGIRAIQSCAADLRSGAGSLLRVVSSPNTGLEIVPRVVAALAAAQPAARFSLEVLPRAAQMIDALVSEQADVGISSVPLEHPLIENKPIGSWQMVCVFPAGHALARKPSVAVDDVQALPLVMFEEDSLQGRIITEWFARGGRTPSRGMLVRSGHMACTLVMQSAGIAFVDSVTAAAWPTPDLQYRPMARSPQFKVNAVWNQNRPPSVLGRRLFTDVDASLRKPARKA